MQPEVAEAKDNEYNRRNKSRCEIMVVPKAAWGQGQVAGIR